MILTAPLAALVCVVALVALVFGAYDVLRTWVTRRTVPVFAQRTRDGWYVDRYGEDIPLASWEDPAHPAYDLISRELALDPRLEQAKAQRDALLAEERWAEAVTATDYIISMLSGVANAHKPLVLEAGMQYTEVRRELPDGRTYHVWRRSALDLLQEDARLGIIATSGRAEAPRTPPLPLRKEYR